MVNFYYTSVGHCIAADTGTARACLHVVCVCAYTEEEEYLGAQKSSQLHRKTIRGKVNGVRRAKELLMRDIVVQASGTVGKFYEKEKDGMIVVYTTSVSVVRGTHQLCQEITKASAAQRGPFREPPAGMSIDIYASGTAGFFQHAPASGDLRHLSGRGGESPIIPRSATPSRRNLTLPPTPTVLRPVCEGARRAAAWILRAANLCQWHPLRRPHQGYAAQ